MRSTRADRPQTHPAKIPNSLLRRTFGGYPLGTALRCSGIYRAITGPSMIASTQTSNDQRILAHSQRGTPARDASSPVGEFKLRVEFASAHPYTLNTATTHGVSGQRSGR